MRNPKLWFWTLALVIAYLIFWSLSPAHKAEKIVWRSIQESGGIKVWKKKQAIQFLQTEVEYNTVGEITQKRISMHRILLQRVPKVRIESVADPSQKKIWGFDGSKSWVMVNGVASHDPAQPEMVKEFIWRSRYFLELPFSLKEPGQFLKQEAKNQIRVTFKGGQSGSGKWIVIYLDKNNRVEKILFSYGEIAEYHDYQSIDGIGLATRRVFYPATEKGEISGNKTREELIEEIEFRVYFSDQLFQAPKS